MKRLLLATLAVVALPALAQAPRAPYQTTKVEGTDNVYIFRAGGHQSMFVVTRDGVIATDPIGYGRPQMVKTYIEEIKKVTDKPIKYLVYSHHHNDHISGGQAFKDAGAKIIAHKRAKERIEAQKDPEMVPPDEVFSKQRT
ncbi:MAG TPA: MBL fold metallo-hydrolase, partial [Burkholderiales bacterium]|nr:MBL fold metallo-hydrolase [Burkholderiales bacterium]